MYFFFLLTKILYYFIISLSLGGKMSYRLIDGEIFIQRGARKVYHNNTDMQDEYVIEYSLDIMDRNNYCIDTRGVDSFYQIFFDEEQFKFYQYRSDVYDKYFEVGNISLEKINEGYIRLVDFLKEAVFVGREFKRILPVITYYGTNNIKYSMKDNAYLDVDDIGKNIVLCMKDNIFLVKHISRFGEEYRIIGCNYIFDGNYEFYGDVYEEYKNMDRVYLEIIEQINNFGKKSGITKVRKK